MEEQEVQKQVACRGMIARWVAREIIPHEPRIRVWFARTRLPPEDVDEVLQEAYCRIAMLDSVDHIASPDAYFFSIARNLLVRRLKRQRIVPFEAIAEIESCKDDGALTPEEQTANRMACEKLMALMAQLPERCRVIVELRKIEGWSQKEIAARMGISEKAVEKQVWLGVRALRAAWDRAQNDADTLFSGVANRSRGIT